MTMEVLLFEIFELVEGKCENGQSKMIGRQPIVCLKTMSLFVPFSQMGFQNWKTRFSGIFWPVRDSRQIFANIKGLFIYLVELSNIISSLYVISLSKKLSEYPLYFIGARRLDS